jgi:exopolysaccharide production protein ExoY
VQVRRQWMSSVGTLTCKQRAVAMREARTRGQAGHELLIKARLVPDLHLATTVPRAPEAGDIWARSVNGARSLMPQPGFNLVPVRALVVGLGVDTATAIADFLRKLRAPSLTPHGDTARPVGGQPKRLLDISVALAALILLCPLMLMVASLIKLTIGGPVIFAHPRVGLNGRTFRCLKFRSMIINGDEVLGRYLESNPAAAREWRENRKLKSDPRVTPLGRLLRKSSLDELPQFFNVLRGEMSCVGPRPIVAAELERYGSHVGCYLGARPGITGMWQVSGRSMLRYRRRVALDRIYVRHWSIWLDIALLVRTVPAVLTFEQAE